MCTQFIGIYYVILRNISPFLNTCFIEDIIQVLRNQGGGEGGYGQILHPDNRGGWGSEKALKLIT